MLRLARFATVGAMIVAGLLLAIALAYLFHGSLEEFPTAEQQDKIRHVMAVLVVALLAVEGGLLLALRRLSAGMGAGLIERRLPSDVPPN